MPRAFPTGKVPRAAGQAGTARPKTELLAAVEGCSEIWVSNWDGILGSLSESLFHWGPSQSQKGISNRILLATPTLGAFPRLLQEAAAAQQALSPPNQTQLKS